MTKEYTANFCLNYGRILDKTYKTVQEAFNACKHFAGTCSMDFGGCYITDEWGDQIYEQSRGGVESFFINNNGYIQEIEAEAFKSAYGLQ